MAGQVCPAEDEEFVWKCPSVLLFSRQPDQAIESPRFSGGRALADTEWVFMFYPRGDDTKESISLFIKRVDGTKGPVNFYAKYRLCLLDVDEQERYKTNCDHTFLNGTAHGVRKLVKRKHLLANPFVLMPRQHIVFKCYLRSVKCSKRPPIHSMLRTRIFFEEVNCTWPIEDFLQVTEDKRQDINLSTNKKYEFFTVSCYRTFDKLHVSIRVRLFEKFFVRAGICVLDKDKKARITEEVEHFFEKKDDCRTVSFAMEEKELAEDFLVDGVLVVKFRFRLSDGGQFSFVEGNLTPLSEKTVGGRKSLRQDVSKQSESVLFPDIRLRVDGESFFAHKSILAARSEFFREKIRELSSSGEKQEADEEGSSSPVLNLEDIDKDTFRRFKKFLYTDSVDELGFDALRRLHAAAVRYDVQLLGAMCLEQPSQLVKPDSAVSALLWSEETKDLSLWSAAVKEIIDHEEDVLASSEWLSLAKDNSELADTVLERLKTKKKSNYEYWYK